MEIAIIGTGYVGLVSGAIFSNVGHNVVCIDLDLAKIASLNNGKTDIYEPGLQEKIQSALLAKTLTFSTEISAASKADAIIIAVGTPENLNGNADLTFIYKALDDVAKIIKKNALIVIKSTVPPGTCTQIARYLKTKELQNDVVMNPEFLREGSAINDFSNPQRIVIGCSCENAADRMRQIYTSWQQVTFLVTDTSTAEMIKYASNTFLATKIAFINQMADICNHISADVEMLSYGLGLDSRIGSQCLKVGPGFGGACFPKDIKALITFSKEQQIDAGILEAALSANQKRKFTMLNKIKHLLGAPLSGKTIGVLGLAFKANTDDVRYSPAIEIIKLMLAEGGNIAAFDPKAIESAKKVLPNICYTQNAEDVFKNADCVVVLTEWHEFTLLNFQALLKITNNPLIIDLRNILDPAKLKGYWHHRL